MSVETGDIAWERERLELRRRQAEADIAAVEAQVEAGELDRATADELLARYRHEIAAASVRLASVADEHEVGPKTGRRWVGAALLLGAFVVAAVMAAQAVQPRPAGSFITGGPVGGGTDLDAVTTDQMEAVIAANPDVPEVAQMRVALANRYFEGADISAALDHYLEGLTGQLRVDQRAQALGRVGWMTYVSGQPELAQRYVEQAITTDPGYAEGTFFLGLIELYGNGDAAAALPLLDEVAAREDVPAGIREQLELARADARAQLGGS